MTDKMSAYTPNGLPIGMFPKNQATTMCVDVVSVYSPPVDTDFKNERSASPASESSAITSSASNSSSICSANNDAKEETNNNNNSMSSKASDKSCLTDSEQASEDDESIFNETGKASI